VTEISFLLDGVPVAVPADGSTLLEALRDRLGVRTAKDGCSPQGQCGCCTVLIDGAPRVACVTPVTRVAGRAVTTVDGLAEDVRDRWAAALVATGGSQCGFCTPGIVVRLAGERGTDDTAVRRSLQAHLCRCTGWQTVLEAADLVRAGTAIADRDLDAAARRATIEGGAPQQVGAAVALGRGGFADDAAPHGALIAVRGPDGEWHVGETLTDARRLAGKVQGRRSSAPVRWPIEVPAGEWVRTLQTTWVEPAYLEPDASWCEPGGEPASPLGNGGAFGGKRASAVAQVARRLADRHGRAVRVLFAREDVVRLGPKRPPMAIGVGADGRGIARVARTAGIAERIREVAPGIEVEELDLAGPPTSAEVRAAGWAEAAVVLAGLGSAPDEVRLPTGAWARAEVGADGTVEVAVRCGDPLDEVVLRSYCIGAAHMALGWVRSEGLAVDDDGNPLDLTIRSFGVLRAIDTPPIKVRIEADDGPPVNGSDAVFAAVAAAAWRAAGHPPRWPCS
jgi:aerobic-type carbon monoxide dehydrogenase small subunit (CoxS/CutS family)